VSVLFWPGDLVMGPGWLWCWVSSQLPVPCRRAAVGQAGAPGAVSARQGAGEDERAWRARAVADDRKWGKPAGVVVCRGRGSLGAGSGGRCV